MDRDLKNTLDHIESSTSGLESLVSDLVELLGEDGPIVAGLREVRDEVNIVARQLDDFKESQGSDN